MTRIAECPDVARLQDLLDGVLADSEQAELTCHLDRCTRCRARAAAVAADGLAASRLFAVEPPSAAAVESALARTRTRLTEPARRTASTRRRLPRLQAPRRLVFAGAAVPVLLVGLLVTASASGWFTIFQPKQFAAVTVSTKELTGLPDLSSFGHMRVDRPRASAAAGAAEAARAAGLPTLQIPVLPAKVPATVHWVSVGQSTASFTFDQAEARQAALAAGRTVPSFPAGIDHSTVSVAGGPGVVALFGTGSTGSVRSMPALVIAEGRVPTVSTDGVSLKQLQDFLLAQPGISPELAAQVRAIGDPASTLPVPVLIGRMSARTVDINGARGLVVGDATGLGAGVVWQRDGLVFAVGGQLADTQVIAIARSLGH
ncbi:MAG: hypothetical protein NVSMB29_08360 [Candidatus Dormibacteria bacterium]